MNTKNKMGQTPTNANKRTHKKKITQVTGTPAVVRQPNPGALHTMTEGVAPAPPPALSPEGTVKKVNVRI